MKYIMIAMTIVAFGFGQVSRVERLKESLALSDEQTRSVDKIFSTARTDIKDVSVLIAEADVNIKNEMEKATPNVNLIKNYLQDKGAALAEMEFIHLMIDIEMRSVLSPEQHQKWRDIKEEIKRRRSKQVSEHRHKGDGANNELIQRHFERFGVSPEQLEAIANELKKRNVKDEHINRALFSILRTARHAGRDLTQDEQQGRCYLSHEDLTREQEIFIKMTGERIAEDRPERGNEKPQRQRPVRQ